MLSLKLVRSFLHYPHPFGLTLMSCTVYEVCDHLLLFDVEVLSAFLWVFLILSMQSV